MDIETQGTTGSRWLRRFLWAVTAMLVVHAAYKLPSGTWLSWTADKDWDLLCRAREYTLFRQGIYPNWHVEPTPLEIPPSYSVYPPYAFPMMAPLFEPGDLVQARAYVWLMSMASLTLLATVAYRTLRPYGREIAALGAASAFTISGNKGAILLGQFSIACTGLVFLQMILLGRGRPWAAGICWTFAMIKPQIALPFAALFLLRRGHLRGLALGIAILVALSWFALAWTGVPVGALVSHWTAGTSLEFSANGFAIGPGALARQFGIDFRAVLVPIVGLAILAIVPAILYLRRLGDPAMLPLAALCSGVGMLAVYHRLYDEIMLFPALLANLLLAASTRRLGAIGIAGGILATFLMPMRYIEGYAGPEALLAAVWIPATVYPLAMLIAARRRGEVA